MNYRVFIEKKPEFDVESAKTLLSIKEFTDIQFLKVYIIYELFDIEPEDYQKAISVLQDSVTDIVHTEIPQSENQVYFAIESIPGQYDQRADWAAQGIQILTSDRDLHVRASKLYLLEKIPTHQLQQIKNYLINTVDSQEKDLSVLALPKEPEPRPIPIFEGFIDWNPEQLMAFYKEYSFAFDFEDLLFIQEYFQSENRDPSETELKVLDTYWSDHCRHTTFMTELQDIKFQGEMSSLIQSVFQKYLDIRKALGREDKPISLMDLGTIMAKYLHSQGKLNDLVISEEINACTIEAKVEVEGKEEDWYLLFKNETHNHPTEIEPFGGASTCIGGAIRDPLSGRAFVYQAMRVTGSANPLEKVEDTLEGKLPQRKITRQAALGYSSYGNQIGLPTSHVTEIYDEGYKAKRMEVGFVVGAVPKDWVIRETPKSGDVVILLGGKTGRDGIGGAVGSSKEHTEDSLENRSAEVQKGDAVEERKIQRLFRKKELSQLIKRCNDFGAGGVSVAIGEIADSILIDLDKMPTKYKGLNGTELAISESQERMAVVVQAKDVENFISLANAENLEAVVVAKVVDTGRMQMKWKDKIIVDLDRQFLNSAGVRQSQKVLVQSQSMELEEERIEFNKENFKKVLADLNVCSQKGLIEHFDSEVGQTTVLMPLSGKNLRTPNIASVHTLPVLGKNTSTVSICSWGYSPKWAKRNPFIMGQYSVIESVSKIVASGGKIENIRLSFQEYFEKLHKEDHKWGNVFQTLLGALEAQIHFEIAAIGGKDSMSGTFKDLNVPPTLISFACALGNIENIISPELKQADNHLYVFQPTIKQNGIPDYQDIIKGYQLISSEIEKGNIISANIVKEGGMASSLFKMAVGNHLGFELTTNLPLLNELPGAIIVECKNAIHDFEKIGTVRKDDKLLINNETFSINDFIFSWQKTLEPIFPTSTPNTRMLLPVGEVYKEELAASRLQVDEVEVFIPIFPGTNCEYESTKVFEEAGAKVHTENFLNRTKEQIEQSVNRFEKAIRNCHILFFVGGFSAGDEPDGSAKFMVSVLNNEQIKNAIHDHLEKGGLILGICNGFQALIKSGLLPYGKIRGLEEDSPTLTYNTIGRHINQTAKIKVFSEKSPWLKGMAGKEYIIPFSHGEGRFYANRKEMARLIQNHQIATQYVDQNGQISENMPFNPNGSVFGVEGITDESGQIYGRMGHPERFRKGLMKNIPEMEFMDIFKNGVDYLKKN